LRLGIEDHSERGFAGKDSDGFGSGQGLRMLFPTAQRVGCSGSMEGNVFPRLQQHRSSKAVLIEWNP
jgi:hypothetical protein